MPFALDLKTTLSTPGAVGLAGKITQVGNVAPQASASYATGSTDTLLAFTCDDATLQLLYLLSDRDITVKTNSSGAPDDTFALKAGIPLVWHKDDPHFTNPLTAPITALYITNASGQTARVEARALHN